MSLIFSEKQKYLDRLVSRFIKHNCKPQTGFSKSHKMIAIASYLHKVILRRHTKRCSMQGG